MVSERLPYIAAAFTAIAGLLAGCSSPSDDATNLSVLPDSRQPFLPRIATPKLSDPTEGQARLEVQTEPAGATGPNAGDVQRVLTTPTALQLVTPDERPTRVEAHPTYGQVVVYGGTPSGIMAAIAAARNGAYVVLLEPGRHLGGMVSGGLGSTDARELENVGGYAKEFLAAISEYYKQTYGPKSTQFRTALNGRKFEPQVAEAVLGKLVGSESRISVFFKAQLNYVQKTGAHIDGLRTSDGRFFGGSAFIDASYEGDLMAAAGVRYVVGREARTLYGEQYAGVLGAIYPFPDKLSGKTGTELLPFIQAGSLSSPGTGDRKVQAYCYRLCLTQRKDIFRAVTPPVGYQESDYELLARYLEAKPTTKFSDMFALGVLPNGKYDLNSNASISMDMIGESWAYPDASFAEREKIARKHRDYQQGLLYFLGHSLRVPETLRTAVASWGFPSDEFVDNDNWPYQLYIREARRMVGQYVLTERDAETQTRPWDSVAVASYMFDSHPVQRVLLGDGRVVNEGAMYGYGARPFGIPYRSISPIRNEASNLLVSVAISASHVIYGAYRMELHYMHVGQAAGTAAGLAVARGVETSDLPSVELLGTLKAQGALIQPVDPTTEPVPRPSPLSIVLSQL